MRKEIIKERKSIKLKIRTNTHNKTKTGSLKRSMKLKRLTKKTQIAKIRTETEYHPL